MNKATISTIAVSVGLLFAFSGPAQANFPDGAGEWADTVYSFQPGTQKDGSPVAPEKSDPWQALGSAESLDNPTIPAGSGLSLGLKGQVTLKFENTIINQRGADIQVFSVHDGNPDLYRSRKLKTGSVLVRASQNCWDYRTIGALSGDGKLNLGSLKWAKCIQFIDRTNARLRPDNSDGFDLDAVRALHSTADQPWDGTTYDTRWWRIDSDLENDEWLGHSLKSARGEASGFCNTLWDRAITFHNNWELNPTSTEGVEFRNATYNAIGSAYDGKTMDELHAQLETMTCDRYSARSPLMRSLVQQLLRIEKHDYLWIKAETPA